MEQARRTFLAGAAERGPEADRAGADGIKLMEAASELADLPVNFISGYGRDETIARALEAGAQDYMVKAVLAQGTGGGATRAVLNRCPSCPSARDPSPHQRSRDP